MRTLKILKDNTILNEWCYSNGDILRTEDKCRLHTFIEKYLNNKLKITVYRGTSDINIYNVDSLDNIEELSERLFMVGNKSLHYLESNHIFHINDCSNQVFEEIFDRLHRICIYDSSNSRVRIRKFLQENSSINEYFSDSRNKAEFIRSIESLENKDRIQIKDYYVALLHTFDYERFPACYMVSTSRSYEVALEFLKGEEPKTPKEGIIIISWVPSSEKERYITALDVNRVNEKIQTIELPVYTGSPYPRENEICVKAGILPHFILGYIQTQKKIFIPNPYLIEQIKTDYNVNSIIKEGITIDQSAFEKILKSTQYRRSYSNQSGEYNE